MAHCYALPQNIDRLLPAYLTSTGLPMPRRNIKRKWMSLTSRFLETENNVAAMAPLCSNHYFLSYGQAIPYEKALYLLDKNMVLV